MVREIILLGDKRLYDKSAVVDKQEAAGFGGLVEDMHDTLMQYRAVHGAGRAIAAPQIGLFKRMIYMYIDKPVVFINPTLRFRDNVMMEVMDDCMSFPNLYVRVRRHKRAVICYKDMEWIDREMAIEGDLSELLQHELDHLDGILATMRAIDEKSFFLKGTF